MKKAVSTAASVSLGICTVLIGLYLILLSGVGWRMGPWMMGGPMIMPILVLALFVSAVALAWGAWVMLVMLRSATARELPPPTDQTASDTWKNCPNCGHGILASWKNCPNCGTKLL